MTESHLLPHGWCHTHETIVAGPENHPPRKRLRCKATCKAYSSTSCSRAWSVMCPPRARLASAKAARTCAKLLRSPPQPFQTRRLSSLCRRAQQAPAWSAPPRPWKAWRCCLQDSAHEARSESSGASAAAPDHRVEVAPTSAIRISPLSAPLPLRSVFASAPPQPGGRGEELSDLAVDLW